MDASQERVNEPIIAWGVFKSGRVFHTMPVNKAGEAAYCKFDPACCCDPTVEYFVNGSVMFNHHMTQ